MRLLFDWETTGLLPWMRGGRPDVTGLCAAALDLDTGEEYVARPGGLSAFTRLVERADFIAGHNIVGFDIPLMELCYGFKLRAEVQIFDTRLVSRMRYVANLLELTARYRNFAGRKDAEREARFPRALLSPAKQHSLESWGYRIGCRKGDYLKTQGVQEVFSEDLLKYCVEDVHVNAVLLDVLMQPDRRGENQWRVPGNDYEPWPYYAPAPSLEACLTECRFGRLKYLQERNGIRFNTDAATKLSAELAARREELTVELRTEWFPEWDAPGETIVPKRDNKARGYVKGVPFTKTVHHVFNPGSRAMIADRLSTLYGWKPKEFTDTGLPKVDEAVLETVDHPAAAKLREYFLVAKRLGQLAEGDKAWMKLVTAEGLIHGQVHPSGTRTSRCSHIQPNTAQVPKVRKHPDTGEIITGLAGGYGAECRALFSPTRPGWVQVGIDASKLELCMLAHRLAFYDGGAFAKELLTGDPHASWQAATGLFFRDNQKTLTYADLYGAGDEKRGMIVLEDWRMAYAAGVTANKPPPASTARELGKRAAAALAAKVLGIGPLKEATASAHKRGWVKGLDGRIIPTKSEHGVLNDVLQGDGAVVMKHAHVMFCQTIRHLPHGLMLDVHDEWQVECPPESAHTIGKIAVECITAAGEKLGVRCPLSGEYKIGANWMETH